MIRGRFYTLSSLEEKASEKRKFFRKLLSYFHPKNWWLIFFRMENFLETSSICGLAHISNSKSILERLYWVVISILMVAATAYLTAVAFNEWDAKPISTIIETFPIDQVQFPKIVVCPPKVSI